MIHGSSYVKCSCSSQPRVLEKPSSPLEDEIMIGVFSLIAYQRIGDSFSLNASTAYK